MNPLTSVKGSLITGFLLAILPPGAFIGLGLLIAGHNWVEQRRAATAARPPLALSPAESR